MNASFAFQYVHLDMWTLLRKPLYPGGKEFIYGKWRNNCRCLPVSTGFSGLSPPKKWSTWSPARFKIPKKDEDFIAALPSATEAYLKRPKFKDGFFVSIIPGFRVGYTCSNCHLVCHSDKTIRKVRYKRYSQKAAWSLRTRMECVELYLRKKQKSISNPCLWKKENYMNIFQRKN